MALTREQHELKKTEVISKFRKSFIAKNYTYNATLNTIIEVLIRDGNPYEIIEMLIINQDELIRQNLKLINDSPIPPILFDKKDVKAIYGMDEDKPIGFAYKKNP